MSTLTILIIIYFKKIKNKYLNNIVKIILFYEMNDLIGLFFIKYIWIFFTRFDPEFFELNINDFWKNHKEDKIYKINNVIKIINNDFNKPEYTKLNDYDLI
jgi:hypothetical protein